MLESGFGLGESHLNRTLLTHGETALRYCFRQKDFFFDTQAEPVERAEAKYDLRLPLESRHRLCFQLGRVWKVVGDASLTSVPAHLRAEVVSPVLGYDDIPQLQEVVRAIRRAGGKINSQCGIHIHIDAAPFDGRHLGNLAKIIYKQEPLILHALGISRDRLNRYPLRRRRRLGRTEARGTRGRYSHRWNGASVHRWRTNRRW